MENSVASVDVREETVAQSLPLRRAFDQSSDVHDVQESGNFAVKMELEKKKEKKRREYHDWGIFNRGDNKKLDEITRCAYAFRIGNRREDR